MSAHLLTKVDAINASNPRSSRRDEGGQEMAARMTSLRTLKDIAFVPSIGLGAGFRQLSLLAGRISNSGSSLLGFMTRNNLANQVSWLLQNITLSRPPQPALPPANNTSVSREAQSFQLARGESQSVISTTRSSETVIDRRARPSSNVSTLTGWGEDSIDIPQVIEVADDNMVRLTSTSKSKRPSLISHTHNPLPTPLGTDEARPKSRHDAYDQHTGQSSRQPNAFMDLLVLTRE